LARTAAPGRSFHQIRRSRRCSGSHLCGNPRSRQARKTFVTGVPQRAHTILTGSGAGGEASGPSTQSPVFGSWTGHRITRYRSPPKRAIRAYGAGGDGEVGEETVRRCPLPRPTAATGPDGPHGARRGGRTLAARSTARWASTPLLTRPRAHRPRARWLGNDPASLSFAARSTWEPTRRRGPPRARAGQRLGPCCRCERSRRPAIAR
jgi:hypothetical protein